MLTSIGWEWSKKSVQSGPEATRRKGRSHFFARSVLALREHGKMVRTPLAAFFNIPQITIETTNSTTK